MTAAQGPSDGTSIAGTEWLRAHATAAEPRPVYGMCTACGSVEVALMKATGTRDLSTIGEHHAYPTGYGCESCS